MLKIIVVDTEIVTSDPHAQELLVAAFPEGRTLADLHGWLSVKPRAPRADKGKSRKEPQ